jgi:transposase
MPPLDQLPAAYLDLSERHDETLSENAQLKLQVAWLQKKLFGGAQSERLDRQQLLLAMEKLEAAAEPEAVTEQVNYERRKPTGEKRPVAGAVFEKLPVRETVTIEPVEVQAAPDAYERIGEERTFEVDITPPQVFKREIIRPKYRVKADRALPPVVAPAPQKPVMGGYASAGLLAWVAISKYLDHLPLYRQEKMLARWGAPISRQTMNDWIRITAEWLEPVYRTMRERVLAEAYVQVDDEARSAKMA